MTEQTPAQKQAAFLASLSEHLRLHPSLVPVSIDPHGALHVWDTPGSRPGDQAGRLAAWFRSLGVTDLRVVLFLNDDRPDRAGYAAIHAYNVALGDQVIPQLWGTVDGLQRLLVEGGPGNWQEGLRLTTADLEHFAAHGTLPEGVQP